jgi:hypothetical protein
VLGAQYDDGLLDQQKSADGQSGAPAHRLASVPFRGGQFGEIRFAQDQAGNHVGVEHSGVQREMRGMSVADQVGGVEAKGLVHAAQLVGQVGKGGTTMRPLPSLAA